MVERGFIMRNAGPIIMAFVSSILLSLLLLAYDATASVRILAAVVVVYSQASLFLHPRQNIVRDPFSLFVVAKAMLLFGFVFSCVFVSTADVQGNDTLLLEALCVGFVTLLVADVGAMLIPGLVRSARVMEPSLPESRFFLGLCLAGWAWRVYAFSSGLLYGTFIGTRLELSGASNVLGSLNALAGTGMWGYAVFSSRLRWAIPLAVAETIWLFMTGSKGAILYILFPLLMVLHRKGAINIDRRFVVGMVFLLFGFLGSFVLVHGYRVAVAKQIAKSGYTEFRAVDAFSDIEIDMEDVRLVGNSVSERLNLAERYLLIAERHHAESEEVWAGRSYLVAFLWYIPRSIWPDKPSMSLGRWFATEYLGWGDESRSEAGVTVWGEALLNFGLIGALIIPGLWIVFLHVIYRESMAIGPWGLVFIASTYLVLMNSLSANVALPLASIGQAAAVLVVMRIATTMLNAYGRRGGVSGHG